jgi:hypothetical protein
VSVYAFLADVMVTIHLAYMAYVVIGQLLIMVGWALRWGWIRNPWFRVSHLLMILVVAGEAFINFECPLTTWERQLREEAGQMDGTREHPSDIDDASFVARLFRKIMFPDRYWYPYIHPGYYTFALLVLLMILVAPPRFRRPPAAAPNVVPPPPAGEPPTVSPSVTIKAPPSPAKPPE